MTDATSTSEVMYHLYLVERIDPHRDCEALYDANHGFVVQALSPGAARRICAMASAGERYRGYRGDERADLWLDSTKVRCRAVGIAFTEVDGAPLGDAIILRSFNAG